MKSPWAKIKEKIKKLRPCPLGPVTKDKVDLKLWGLNLTVSRETTSDVPAELTVVIPRAECRTGSEEKGHEVILSSITVVIAPRHPTEHGTTAPPPPGPG
ncbi:MAG TPA: hypothetical protein GX504_00010 [Clostridia bacterium]|nr:hypothetical protein [Clostridia bacterium]